MTTKRFIDESWHHYCVRDNSVKHTITSDYNEYLLSDAQHKFSYLQDFMATETSLGLLEKKIHQHLKVADHVYVGLGEPLVVYKDPDKHGWDYENNRPDGPYYFTDDFINKFSKDDHVTFFANVVSHVPLNRPLHYLNDMFFQGINIYKDYDLCKNLLRKLTPSMDKKYKWELMCSNHQDLYKLLKEHPVDKTTFSTCHGLGITHWGPDVIAPTDQRSAGQTIAKDHNIRVSDLVDPSIYNQSHYSCVVETVIPEDNRMSMFSEKEAKPIITKRPFIIVGTKDHLKAFRGLGFKTFSSVIDESYDDEPDYEKRLVMILDAMDKLSKLDVRDVYRRLQGVLDHNHKHFYNHNWNMELMQAWYQTQPVT